MSETVVSSAELFINAFIREGTARQVITPEMFTGPLASAGFEVPQLTEAQYLGKVVSQTNNILVNGLECHFPEVDSLLAFVGLGVACGVDFTSFNLENDEREQQVIECLHVAYNAVEHSLKG